MTTPGGCAWTPGNRLRVSVAGADWPTSLRLEVSDSPLDAVADPLDADQPLLPADARQRFFAGIDRRDNRLAAGITVTATTGVSEIGGVVHRDHRGQGFGHEMLSAVCGLLHGHFGVARLVAGCEEANVASRRWLAGAGFTPAGGAPTYRLATGRVTRPLWYSLTYSAPSRPAAMPVMARFE